MTIKTVTYDLDRDESARRGWYLHSRDHFLANLARRVGSKGNDEVRTALDAGCGPGGLVGILTQTGLHVTGIDADEASLLHGYRKGKLSKLVRGSLCALPFKDNSFDICISSEVLEHVQDDAAALRELLRVSRGPVIVTVPAHPYLWTDSDKILLHHRRYAKEDIVRLVRGLKMDCRLSRVRPYGVLPALGVLFYKSIRKRNAPTKDIPLAARFTLPRWADSFLAFLFRCELDLSCLGLVPWGHGWWFVVEKPSGSPMPSKGQAR